MNLRLSTENDLISKEDAILSEAIRFPSPMLYWEALEEQCGRRIRTKANDLSLIIIITTTVSPVFTGRTII